MKDFMPKKNQEKILSENVLAVSAKARQAKEQDNNIINATAGSYYDNAGNIKVFKCIEDAFNHPTYNKYLSYASIQGSNEFMDSVKSWILGEEYLEEYASYHINVIATSGGTGAISLSVGTYLEKGDVVLLPDIMWPAYTQILKNQEIDYLTYKLYDEVGKFNLANLKELAIKVAKTIGKVFVVINDPCHNPTGFVMSHDEYKGLVDVLNEVSKTAKVVLLMDIAYLDYGTLMGTVTRKYFKEFKNLSDNVMVLYAFSASKTFGIYGFRLGALMQLTTSEKEANLFNTATSYFARSTWSNSSHLGISIVTDTLSDKVKKQTFINELKAASFDLEERSLIFLKELEKYNVPHAPYQNGFFILLLVNNQCFEAEIEKNGAYGCHFGSGYRLSLASINKEEAFRLANIVGTAYQKILGEKNR